MGTATDPRLSVPVIVVAVVATVAACFAAGAALGQFLYEQFREAGR